MRNSYQQPPPLVERPKFLLGKLRLSLLIGVFILGSIIFIYDYYSKRDDLIKFAPLNSGFYFHVRNQIWPTQASFISNLPLTNFYQKLDEAFNFNQQFTAELLSQTKAASFLLLPTAENKLDWVIILRLENNSLFDSSQVEAKQQTARQLIANQPYSLFLKRNTYAIATNSFTLESIKQVKDQKVFSLAKSVKPSILANHVISLYLNIDNLNNYFTQDDLLLKWLSAATNEAIYLGANPKKDYWQFKIISPEINFTPSAASPLIEYLPPDFLFYSTDVNIIEIFNYFAKLDANLNNVLKQINDSAIGRYQFNPLTAMAGLNQSANLLILPTSTDSFLDFDFALITAGEIDFKNFESLVSLSLAQKSPRAVKRLLPDKTTVTELEIHPESLAWQDYFINEELTGRYLNWPKLNFTMAYINTKDRLVITNSTSTLTKLEPPGIKLSSWLKCGKGDSFFIINTADSDYFSESLYQYLPQGKLIIMPNGKEIKGCYYN